MNWLDTFLHATAWPMEKPEPYGAFHLIFFFVGFAVVFLLACLLRNTNEKQNRAVLLSVGTFLLLSELYKQFFYFYVVENHEYAWWIFPFQLCSVPMYLCFIAAFLPDGKVRNGMYNFLASINLMGGFIAFIEPSGLMHEYWTLTLHALVWHMSLVFLGLYLGISRRAGRELKDYRYSALTFVGLSVVAFCINLIFWNAADGDINMFYVGPRTSPLFIFETIAKNWGWYVCTPIYITLVCAGGLLFFLPFWLRNRKPGVKKEPVD